MYSLPRDHELANAVIEIVAGSAVLIERGLVVNIAAPPPVGPTLQNAGTFHDPADSHAAPEHGKVVGLTLAPDLGFEQENGFAIGHHFHIVASRRSGRFDIDHAFFGRQAHSMSFDSSLARMRRVHQME
jgi:hypothetical protein